MRPTIAAVLISHNHGHFLAAALTSVVTQTRRAERVLVVDDGSTDETAKVAAEFGDRVQTIRTRHNGAAAARNVGWRAASTDVVAFLDADDVWYADKLAKQEVLLLSDPRVALVYGDTMRTTIDGSPIDRWSDHFAPASGYAFVAMLRKNRIQTSTVLVRHCILAALGGFDESLTAWEDIDLWVRIARAHRLAYVPDLVAQYRMGWGLSSRSMAMARGELGSVSRIVADGRVPRSTARYALANARAHVGIAHYLGGDGARARIWIRDAWREDIGCVLRERTVATYVKAHVGRRRLQSAKERLRRAVGCGVWRRSSHQSEKSA